LTHATQPTLLALISEVDTLLCTLPEQDWIELFQALRYGSRQSRMAISVKDLPEHMSQRFACIVAGRADRKSQPLINERYFSSVQGADKVAIEFVLATALDISNMGSQEWTIDLDLVSKAYKHGATTEPSDYFLRFQEVQNVILDRTVAERIAHEPGEYPGFLVALAQDTCKSFAAAEVFPVSKVANGQKWFAESNEAGV
jgi:hypothetical protein